MESSWGFSMEYGTMGYPLVLKRGSEIPLLQPAWLMTSEKGCGFSPTKRRIGFKQMGNWTRDG